VSVASRPSGDPAAAGLFAHDLSLDSPVVIGADEAGRGSLAGPIVAAAVAFDRPCLESLGNGALAGLDDSKRLTAGRREALVPAIVGCALRVSVISRSARFIDDEGLHRTNQICLGEAVLASYSGTDAVRLIDGFDLPECPVEHRKIVKGDRTSAAVAAASVIAKVTRDRFMVRAAGEYPGYGFERHKGYASKEHLAAIAELGPTLQHRLSFRSSAYDGTVDAGT
jgi:ribonuclease HII